MSRDVGDGDVGDSDGDVGDGDDGVDVGDSDDHSGALRSDRLWCLHILHCDLEFFRMRGCC